MTRPTQHETPLPPSKAQRLGSCRSCSAPIIWLKTFKGHNMPVDYATVKDLETLFDRAVHTSHFDTCPAAAHHRKIWCTVK